MTSPLPRPAALALLLLASACSDTPEIATDLCDSPQEALSESRCQLTLGEELARFLSRDGDVDWYALTVPATLPPRALLRVRTLGGEGHTPVRLDLRVLREDGSTHVGAATSRASGAAVDLLLPWVEPGARLLVQVMHDAAGGGPASDAARPYVLQAEVLQDPDANEPNDVEPTPLALTPQPDGTLQGEVQGTLASQDDVDRYAFSVASSARVQVLYLQLTSPALDPAPAVPLRYVLTRQDGGEHAAEVAPEGGAPVRLVSARTLWPFTVPASPLTVSYVLEVRGAGAPAPGDLRQAYSVLLRVLEREDPSEPNDAPDAARLVALQAPDAATHTVGGRLETSGDEDWFAASLSALQRPSVLRYRLVPREEGGRFPALSEPDRLLTVHTQVAKAACESATAQCPGLPTTPLATAAREAACGRSVPHCLQALRSEAPGFGGLRNFEGVLPVPSHSSEVRYVFQVASSSGRYADDRAYALELTWEEDPDEAVRAPSGGEEQPSTKPLAEDTREGAGIAPPAGEAFEVQGTLLAGHGLRSPEAPASSGVRAPEDYDAVPSDVDVFRFQLPAGLSAPMDRTWKLQWEVEGAPGAGAPSGLALDLTFCDGDVPGTSGCTPVSVGSRGGPLTLRHLPGPQLPWHAPQTGAGPLLLTRQEVDAATGRTTVTLTEEACPCLEPRLLRGGLLTLRVSALDRTSHAPAHYTLRTAFAPYPRAFSPDGVGQALCPAQCLFTHEP